MGQPVVHFDIIGRDPEALPQFYGVTSFQQYGLPGTSRDGDIHIGGAVKMAWFKDPSGNIFEINGRN